MVYVDEYNPDQAQAPVYAITESRCANCTNQRMRKLQRSG